MVVTARGMALSREGLTETQPTVRSASHGGVAEWSSHGVKSPNTTKGLTRKAPTHIQGAN